MTAAVEVRDLGKRFRLYRDKNHTLKTALLRGSRASFDELWAVRGVTFDVAQGSTFGLIGSNGSGKSTLLRCLARILRADEGHQQVNGRVAALLELGSGFHHELTGRQNVYLNGTILGMKQRDLDRRMDEIVSFAGLEDAIDQPVKNYSSGMYARLGFAVATSVEPEVLLVDEVLAVGDVAFQRRCIDRIQELRREGRTVVIVSHDSAAIRTLCDSAAWLVHGVLQDVGPTEGVLDRYLQSVDPCPSTAGNEVRRGRGEVVLSAITMVAADGRPTVAVRGGDPVAFQITWEVRQHIPDLVIGLAMRAANGTRIWVANSSGQQLKLQGAVGTGTVRLQIPRLCLQPGEFSLDFAGHDLSGAAYNEWRRVLTFTVLEPGWGELEGYVSLTATWVAGARPRGITT